MTITIRHEEDGLNEVKAIQLSDCKCGREPVFVTRWQTKNNDPETEIPIAYYIQCAFCGIKTKVTSCKKAKSQNERLKVVEKVVEEWNEKIADTH